MLGQRCVLDVPDELEVVEVVVDVEVWANDAKPMSTVPTATSASTPIRMIALLLGNERMLGLGVGLIFTYLFTSNRRCNGRICLLSNFRERSQIDT
jgi:hypothetical protein